MVTPFVMMQRVPRKHPFPIETGLQIRGVISPHCNSLTRSWKSVSKIIAPAPMIVPSPIFTSTAAQTDVLLIPTFFPISSNADAVSVRSTHLEALPKGLHLGELMNELLPESIICDPGKTETIGRPRKRTGPLICTPRKRASATQRVESARRPIFAICPSLMCE